MGAVRKFITPWVLLATVGTSILQGCATPGVTVSADDVCRAERAELKAVEDFFIQSAVQGAIGGAVAGGLAGALIGGDTKGALIGAAAGAAVGGIGAYYLAKQNATSNPAELTQSIYSDVNAENQQLDRVTDIFRRLRSCRIATAQGIKTDFQQGRLPRDQASVKLAAVRALYQEDIQFTEALGGRIGERSDGYKFASDELLKTDPNAAQTLAARRAAEPPMPAMGLGGGPVYEANTAANVREAANANAKRVAGLAKGEQVVVLEGGKEWSRIRLANGATGYVSSRLINPPGQAPRPSQQAARPAPTKPPPMDVAGVAQLTESNQLKRRGLESEVATAKSEVASAAFTLEGGGISARPGLPELAEG